MGNKGLAVHETMELHEILTFKTVCMTKSKTLQGFVTDEDLKSLMQADVEQSTRAIHELQNLLSRVLLMSPTEEGGE
ncbi:spore coat protein CotF [Bacillaceae bacterium]